jgi:hypothetical protein
MQARWQVVEQESQGSMHRLGADQVVVIQYQRHVAGTGPFGQLVDQGRYQALERLRDRRPEQRTHPLADPGADRIQRGHRMAPEAGRVVVARIQRQPRHRLRAVPGPAGQQRRLTITGRRADKHQATPQGLIEPFRQPGAGQEIRAGPGRAQLSRQQGGPPGHLRYGRRGPLSHR